MKRIAIILLAVLLVLSLSACKSTEENPKGNGSLTLEDRVNAFLETIDLDLNEEEKNEKGDTTPIGEFYDSPYPDDLTSYVTLERNDYFGIELGKSEIKEVTAEDMLEAINEDLEENAEYVSVTDRSTEMGDIVNIDFKGYVDGVAFDGGEAVGYEMTLGKANFIDGFEEAIVGHKVGEIFTIDVTFPENYGNEELNGKAAKFDIKLNHITEIILPELTEKFVQETFFLVSIDDYLRVIYAEVNDKLNQEAKTTLKNKAYNMIFDSAVINSLPEDAVSEYRDKFYSAYTKNAESMNVTLESFVNVYIGITLEEFEEQITELSEAKVEEDLIAFTIAKNEGFFETLTKGDYDSYAEMCAKQYGLDVKTFEEINGTDDIWKSLILETAIQFVIDNANSK